MLQVYTALWENWKHTRVVQEEKDGSGIFWYGHYGKEQKVA